MAWPKGKSRKQVKPTASAVPVALPGPSREAILLDTDVAEMLRLVAALGGYTPSQVIRAMSERIKKPPVKM
jgi:hypothetical protein